MGPHNPIALLAAAFRELMHSKRPITGSSTACILVLDHLSNKLFTVNIGDSGFLVVRKGRVVHKSEEQQHYFNAPFQLSLPPPGHDGSALNDSPESANQSQFAVEDGDVILLATDGVFDNVPQPVLVKELSKLGGVRDKIYSNKQPTVLHLWLAIYPLMASSCHLFHNGPENRKSNFVDSEHSVVFLC